MESSGVVVGTTHSFDQMGSRLDINHPYRERILDFDEALSGASTRYRYPTESGSVRVPYLDDVNRCLDEVQAFIEEAKRFVVSAGFNLRR